MSLNQGTLLVRFLSMLSLFKKRPLKCGTVVTLNNVVSRGRMMDDQILRRFQWF